MTLNDAMTETQEETVDTPANSTTAPIIINGEVCTPETHCFKNGTVVLKKDGSPRRKPGPSIGTKYKKGSDDEVAADLAKMEAADKPKPDAPTPANNAAFGIIAHAANPKVEEPMPQPQPSILREVKAQVSRTYGKIGANEGQEETIEVRGFVTPPATVEIGYGLTLNIGNYESARVDVKVTVPCYREETDAAYDWAKDWAEQRVRREVDSVRKMALPQKSNPF